MVYIQELDAIMRPSIVDGSKFEGQPTYVSDNSLTYFLFSAPRLFHLSGPLQGGPPTILRDREELDALVRQVRLEARLRACANLSRRPPLPSPLAKEVANTESTGDYFTGKSSDTTESTGDYFSGKSSFFSEPTATTSSVVSHNTGSRFRRCTRVSSATGTTTVTTTTTSRGSYSTRPSVRPDPVRQATLPPPPSPPQPRVQKPRKTIEIDHLPGGKFPRIGKSTLR